MREECQIQIEPPIDHPKVSQYSGLRSLLGQYRNKLVMLLARVSYRSQDHRDRKVFGIFQLHYLVELLGQLLVQKRDDRLVFYALAGIYMLNRTPVRQHDQKGSSAWH